MTPIVTPHELEDLLTRYREAPHLARAAAEQTPLSTEELAIILHTLRTPHYQKQGKTLALSTVRERLRTEQATREPGIRDWIAFLLQTDLTKIFDARNKEAPTNYVRDTVLQLDPKTHGIHITKKRILIVGETLMGIYQAIITALDHGNQHYKNHLVEPLATPKLLEQGLRRSYASWQEAHQEGRWGWAYARSKNPEKRRLFDILNGLTR